FGIIVKMFFFTKNIKVVYTRHSETSPSYLSRYMFYLCDQVVTLTMKVKKDFPLPSICIPHGVDADHYSFQPKSHISFPKCKKFIGVVGRVRPEKGQKDVLMAALPLLQSDSELGLIILGKVKRSQLSYKNMINHMALTYGVKNQIFFIDTVEDIRPYYQMFSITIVASYSEGFSMVPLEVMASSKLVIATHDVGIHDELIMNGQTGYLFNAGNIDELSTLLKDNLYKNDKLKMIGLNARREILLNWTIETESRRLIALYESLFI
ncbi:MAG: glycosyltransferase family 4 protein, partial [Gammaproteobacteria bacterium]|nr:glycosyltransferase family 4 protein [Gammaproteobacteria bacterium]